MFPLTDNQKALEALQEVVNNPEKYVVVQSEADVGVATMSTMGEPTEYNKVHLAITFLEKDKIPMPQGG